MATTVNLTHSYLEAEGVARLVAGTDWMARMQIREPVSGGTTQAVSLDGATVEFLVLDSAESMTLVSRTTDATIAGASPAAVEIEHDSDQDEEDSENETGMGWFTVRFANAAGDTQKLSAAAGRRRFRLQVTLPDSGDGEAEVAGVGVIEIGS